MIRMKIQVAALLVILGLRGIAEGQQPRLSSQIKIPPNCLADGVGGNERIITGTIAELRPGLDRGPFGSVVSAASVTIRVDRYVQGPHFANDSVNLPVDWTHGHSKPWILTKPLWYDVNVTPGEKLLLTVLTVEQAGASDLSGFWTPCVFELDNYSSSVPILEKMAFLDSTEGSAEVKTPQRLQALEAIVSVYDGYTVETRKANSAIRSFMTDRIGDSDPKVSDAAIRWVYSQVQSDGTKPPDSAWFWIRNRDKVLKQLRSEATGGLVRREAMRVLQFFGCQSATNTATCRLR